MNIANLILELQKYDPYLGVRIIDQDDAKDIVRISIIPVTDANELVLDGSENILCDDTLCIEFA
jgi:hypothetical protein